MLKVRTLFSGIGSPESALKNLEIPYELVDFCEVDKYAVKSYCAVHGVSEDKNLGDITKVWGRNLPYADLLVWGFPCQDISVAGKQRGLKEGETRSGLYYEGFRILKETKPKYSVIENVKNLVGKKFKTDFESMLEDIESLGYNNYWKVLNAKDYGIPQNRERVFIVSIRKDIDTGTFNFPKGFDNGLRLKDLLEQEAEEKYYISQEKTDKLIKQLKDRVLVKEATKKGYAEAYEGDSINLEQPTSLTRRGRVGKQIANTLNTSAHQAVVTPCIVASRGRNPENPSDRTSGNHVAQRLEINTNGTSNTLTSVQKDNYVLENKVQYVGNVNPSGKGMNGGVWSEEGLSPTLTTNKGEGNKILQIGMLDIKGNEQVRRVYDPEGCSPTLNTCGGGNRQPKILRYERTEYGKEIRKQYEAGEIKEKIGNMRELSPREDGISNTLTTVQKDNLLLEPQYRIRKLTPKECWRLMGFKDEEFERAAEVCSASQLYKQAGNSIVTNCLFYIFKNLLQAEIAAIYDENKELS